MTRPSSLIVLFVLNVSFRWYDHTELHTDTHTNSTWYCWHGGVFVELSFSPVFQLLIDRCPRCRTLLVHTLLRPVSLQSTYVQLPYCFSRSAVEWILLHRLPVVGSLGVSWIVRVSQPTFISLLLTTRVATSISSVTNYLVMFHLYLPVLFYGDCVQYVYLMECWLFCMCIGCILYVCLRICL